MQHRQPRREFARLHVEQVLVAIGVLGIALAILLAVWSRA
jgi:hypothetical protein